MSARPISRKALFDTIVLGLKKQARTTDDRERQDLIQRASTELQYGPDLVLDRLHERFGYVRARAATDDDAMRIVAAEYLKDTAAAMAVGRTYSEECEARLAARLPDSTPYRRDRSQP